MVNATLARLKIGRSDGCGGGKIIQANDESVANQAGGEETVAGDHGRKRVLRRAGPPNLQTVLPKR